MFGLNAILSAVGWWRGDMLAWSAENYFQPDGISSVSGRSRSIPIPHLPSGTSLLGQCTVPVWVFVFCLAGFPFFVCRLPSIFAVVTGSNCVTAAEGTGYGLLIMTRSAAFRFCFFEPFCPAFLCGKPPVRQQKLGRIMGSHETAYGNTL